MNILLLILLSTFIITLCVWIAVLFMFFQKKVLDKITLFLMSLSAGTLMGGAFLHLLPEASEKVEINLLFILFLLSFVCFFLIEKLLHWRHCHKAVCPIHTFGYMNLFGDSIHNFIDGLIIASTFMINPVLGFSTTLAIAMHEIPQEIGDYGVLIYAGFKRKNALFVNYLVALTVVIGGIVGYFSFLYIEGIIPYILPFAAGGFVYIASSDLIPEIRNEKSIKKSMLSMLVFIIGIMFMYFIK